MLAVLVLAGLTGCGRPAEPEPTEAAAQPLGERRHHPSDPICTDAGFCWESPLPQGNAPAQVWASGSADVWMIGSRGTVTRWDGHRWSRVAIGTTANLGAIVGRGPRDIWIGGADTLWHYDGRRWQPLTGTGIGRPSSIWLDGRRNLWVAGLIAPQGQSGSIVRRFDGRTWTTQLSTTSPYDSLSAVWGTGPSNVWVVGGYNYKSRNTTLHHYDGSTWTSQSFSGIRLQTLWGSGASDIWAAGESASLHYDGAAWSPVPFPVSARSLTGTSKGDIWATGYIGTAHFDGTSWTTVDIGAPDYLLSIWAASPRAVFAVGNHALLRYDGRAWHNDFATLLDNNISSVVGVGHKELWATTGEPGTLLHHTGAGWTKEPGGPDQYLSAIWASGPRDVWAVGGTTAVHYDGATWTEHPLGANLLVSVAGSGPRDVWAVDVGSGLLRHFDGTSWATVDTGTTSLYAVWANAPDDVWAVGGLGTATHFDGTTWTPSDTGTNAYAVWASGPRDAWAVGDAIAHFDGTAWTQVLALPPGAAGHVVWGRRADDVWVAAYGGALLHFDGGAWSAIDTGADVDIGGIWGDRHGLWLVGYSSGWGTGAILRTR